MSNKSLMTVKSQRLLEEFSEAAQNWGWASDAGHGKGVINSEQAFIKAKGDLHLHILNKERTIRHLQKQLKELKSAQSIVIGPQGGLCSLALDRL